MEEDQVEFSEDFDFQIHCSTAFSKHEQRTFTVKITNNSIEPLLANSKLVLEKQPSFCDQSVALFEESLAVGESADVTLTFKPRCASFRGVPEYLIFRIGEKYYRAPLEMKFFFSFFGDLPVEEFGATNLNILLLGLSGATKSSFVNSVYTLFSESLRPVHVAPSGSTQTHVTKHLTKYQVRPNILLWDMWGISPQNYDEVLKILPLIFKGHLPSGWGMQDCVANRLEQIEANVNTAHKRRIHATILFVPQSLINDPNLVGQREMLVQLKKFIKERFNMNVLVLMTKMDEVDANIRTDPFKDFAIQSIKEKVTEEFDAIDAHVFYNLNYTHEEKRNFMLDKLNFIILEQASRFAIEFLRKGTK